jgi:hypothetical protein
LKDPTIPDPKERKKFMFYDSEKRQVDLRIRLKYDGLNQSHFFRAMISGYLENNFHITTFLDEYKEKNQLQGINKREASKRLIKQGEDVKVTFGLNEDDIKSVFDLIAEEHPDL